MKDASFLVHAVNEKKKQKELDLEVAWSCIGIMMSWNHLIKQSNVHLQGTCLGIDSFSIVVVEAVNEMVEVATKVKRANFLPSINGFK